jgi:hypothetical protein
VVAVVVVALATDAELVVTAATLELLTVVVVCDDIDGVDRGDPIVNGVEGRDDVVAGELDECTNDGCVDGVANDSVDDGNDGGNV